MSTVLPSSSCSPSSELTAKPHPYQCNITPGPIGAYEARHVKGGLYVRVDMPGVPHDGVKVVKYNETRTVTFTGKAPVLWPGFDTSERVYAGYVVLDRDPDDVEVKSEVKDGCLRLSFPRCDGSLHFLSRSGINNNTNVQHDETGQDGEEKINAEPIITFIMHAPTEPSGMRLVGGKPEHINPYLLSGVKGVYEHKIVNVKGGGQVVYVRLDVPGSSCKTTILMENFDCGIGFGGQGFKKDSRFDEGTRGYMGVLQPNCKCCRYRVENFNNTDGVLRFLVHKSDNLDPAPVLHCTVPPSRPGGPLLPSTVKFTGRLTPTLGVMRFY